MNITYSKKIIGTLLAVAILSLLLVSCREPDDRLETFTARKGDIAHTVTSTGYIEAMETKSYSLQAGGEVLLSAEEGQSFSAGELLFEVDNARTVLNIEQAEENLMLAQSSLSQAEISFQQALDNNHIAVQLAESNKKMAQHSTESALIALQDAQRLAGRSSQYARTSVDVSRSSVEGAQVAVDDAVQNVENTRQAVEDAEQALADAQKRQDEAADPQEEILAEIAVTSAEQALAGAESAHDAAQSQVRSLQASYDTAKAQLKSAQAAYEQAKAQADSQVHSAESGFEQAHISQGMTYWSTLAETQNAQKQIMLAREAINQAESQLNLARISVDMASLDLDKNKVVAPFEGMVLSSMFSSGELASPGVNVISIVSDQFVVSSDIAETDIVRVQVGQEVRFTLDAYRGREYTGTVMEISPVPDHVGGIVTYSVKVKPDDSQDFLYGLTANLTISSIEAEDVLLVLIEAIYEKDGVQYVDIVKDEDILATEIETGAFSFEYVEIVSGLNMGDEVVTAKVEHE